MTCKHCGRRIYQPSVLKPAPPDVPWVHAEYTATDHNAEPLEDPDGPH